MCLLISLRTVQLWVMSSVSVLFAKVNFLVFGKKNSSFKLEVIIPNSSIWRHNE